MRLNNYLTEDTNQVTFEQLKKDCSEYLEVVKNSRPLYRGYNGVVTNKPFTPRTDRRPMDMSWEIHDLYDAAFYKKFGWKARSEGVFVTADCINASPYGKLYNFFPFDGFKFIWSKKVVDLYLHTDRNLSDRDHGLEKFIDNTVGTYNDTNLKRAMQNECEIIFKCKAYYLSIKNYMELIRK